MSIKQVLAVLNNSKDSSMHSYFEVKNSLEAVCLGQRSRAWIKSGLDAWKGRDHFWGRHCAFRSG